MTTIHTPVTTDVCVRGCTRGGMHHDGCDPEADQCRGCIPRTATDGHLCWPCYRRLQRMLVDLPIAERWLQATAGRTTSSALREDHEMRRGGDDDGAPAPLNLAAIDACDNLRIVLNNWGQDYDDIDNLGRDGDVDGWSVTRCCEHFLAHLERLADWEHVDALITDLASVLATAHTIAPWRPTAQRVPHVPCPECERTALIIFGGDEDVTCTACHAMIPPGRYGIWVCIFEAEHRAHQAQREAADRAAELLAVAA